MDEETKMNMSPPIMRNLKYGSYAKKNFIFIELIHTFYGWHLLDVTFHVILFFFIYITIQIVYFKSKHSDKVNKKLFIIEVTFTVCVHLRYQMKIR